MKKWLISPKYALSLKLGFILIIFSIANNLVAQDFKTVGYLPYYRFNAADLIAYEKLTHLNLAFGYPDADGNISVGGQEITSIVNMAHDHDLEVYLSIAGGNSTTQSYWANLLQPGNRTAFIHKLVTFTVDNNLQGIDVDLEWGDVTANYSPFVLELNDSLDAHSLAMTAALPGHYRYPDVSNEAVEAYDWINMMVYDHTGPWAPNSPGQHSPYSKAVDAIEYWSVTQGVPTEKLTLGVPFYGYNFNDPGDVYAFTYGSMVLQDVANAEIDQVGLSFYNGRPTIEAKTNLALSNVSGIMVWELGQDAFGSNVEYSLLEVIYQTILDYFVDVEETAIALEMNVYPNPFNDVLHVEQSAERLIQVQLNSISGEVIWRTEIDASNQKFDIPTDSFSNGFYILSLNDGKNLISKKVVKY
jgi:hypothetical protein